MRKYSDNLRELREDNDLEQSHLARVLGTTQQMYSRYENGHTELPLRHLITLAKYYKTSTDYILGLQQTGTIYGQYEKLQIIQKERVNAYIKGMLES